MKKRHKLLAAGLLVWAAFDPIGALKTTAFVLPLWIALQFVASAVADRRREDQKAEQENLLLALDEVLAEKRRSGNIPPRQTS